MMMNRFWRVLLAAIILLSLPAPMSGSRITTVYANAADAQELFDSMSVADRIGQLFLVTFEGSQAHQNSDVTDLILNYRVGGVVLLAQNDNMTDQDETGSVPLQVAELANRLQRIALLGQVTTVPQPDGAISDPDAAATTPIPTLTPTPAPPDVAIPLLIATLHEGDGYPNTNILSGLTEIPNNMAIGATWQPRYAQTVGEIVGQELSAIGVNMLLGPSLDVLENPAPFSPGDLGTRTFGGDPYWVGLMGQAYTTGVHNGGNGRIAVVAKHFPGYGSSDRPIDEEVPTVYKSLEQLKQTELAPFFAVTGSPISSTTTVDALLTTHIRYQGFQGNIQATTNPISFDRQALATLMELPEFAGWRAGGGILVSDALGARAVARFYDDTGQEFPHRRVAKDALLAGNDLLYLADFALGDTSYDIQLINVKDTILWFQEIYQTDQLFQERVDEAVLRILGLKLRLYEDDFSANNVLVDTDEVTAVIEQGDAAISDLARAAITLISPSRTELAGRLTSPPGVDDRITIFTDIQQARQCTICPPQPLIGETALQERILALYGPEASEQIQANQIRSFSLDDLQAFLDAGPGPIVLPTIPISPTLTPEPNGEQEETAEPTPTPTPIPTPTPPPAYLVQESLRGVDWIIFAMLDADQESPTLNTFLAQRPDIVRDANVIVFAYNAPYYLDTTDISKLTAYFGVYSKIDPFIDASMRALFQESLLSGGLPVNVEAISYDLFTQTQPDPNQVIELFILAEGETQAPPSEAPLDASIGDTLHLQTGIIYDRNGNPVPDGTIVQFIQQDRIQGIVSIITETPTINGVAHLDYVLEARTGAGQFRITAETGAATISQEVDISIEEEAQVAIITPTPTPTTAPTPTPTPTATPTATSTPIPSPTITPTLIPSPPQEPAVRIELSEFQMLAAIFAGLLMVGNLGLVIGRRQAASLTHRIGWPLWGFMGGLLAYNYFALALPGTAELADLGSWAGLFTTVAGGLVGLVVFQVQLWVGARRA